MITGLIADVLAALLLVVGCGFFAAGTMGLLRFGDINTRLHALAKADNLGLGFVLAGLAVYEAAPAVAVKLVLIWALALLAAATNAHLIARREDNPESDNPESDNPESDNPVSDAGATNTPEPPT